MIIATLGLIVGIILALTGAGGGILAVPLLIFGVGLGVAQAAPIGLLAVGLASALGAVLGLRAGIVRYKAALLMASAGMLLAPLGVWQAQIIDGRWLSWIFAGVLLLVAWRTLLHAGRAELLPLEEGPESNQPPCVRDHDSGRFVWTTPCARALALSGSIAGLLSGLLGVGGGFVIVPALRRYTDLPMQSAVATSLSVIALVAISGVGSSLIAGSLDWGVALPFCAGTLAGMLGGRLLANRLTGPHLQRGFASVAALVAIGMIVKSVL